MEASACCPFNHKQRCLMCLLPCLYWNTESIARRDYCLCCQEVDRVDALNNIPLLMEIGGTWTEFLQNIPIWWIIFRFFGMIYLFWTTVIVQSYIYADEEWGFWYYFYKLSLWANTTAMLSMIVKFVSTITAYKIIKNGKESNLSNYAQYRKLYFCHKVLLWITLPSLTIVGINYWFLEYDPDETEFIGFRGYDSINLHSIAVIVYMMDFLLSLERFYYKNALWSVLFGYTYGLWTVIFAVAELKTKYGETTLYSVIDWREDATSAFIVFLFTMIEVFAIASLYTVCKNGILLKYGDR